jgi:hypothetical protein
LNHDDDYLAVRTVLWFDRRPAFIHEYFNYLVEFLTGTDGRFNQLRHGFKGHSIWTRDDLAMCKTCENDVSQMEIDELSPLSVDVEGAHGPKDIIPLLRSKTGFLKDY